ncbi:MAG: RNA polymerase sigma factor [Clostridia bacterium]|nr:RNA polymerase sigma factor [Clostridia bacterium]
MDNCAEIYRRFLDGDESAVGEIMEKVFYSLVFFTDSYVRDVHSAEDIALEVMSELFVHKRGYDFRVSLKTYLFMLAKSRASDFIRHRSVLKTEELSEALDAADERADLEKKVLKDERARAVNDAIAGLPEDMRTAVHLVFFEGLSYKEAAKVMRKNSKQIDNLLYRAKKVLRELLADEKENL